MQNLSAKKRNRPGVVRRMLYGACGGAVLLLFALLGACTYGGRAPAPPENIFRAPFALSADYTDGELTGSLYLERADAQSFSLTFTSPDSIAGFTVAVSGGRALMTLQGIQSEGALADLPDKNPARALSALFSAADAGKATAQTQENGDTVYTFLQGEIVTAYAGAVKAIDIPAADLHLKVTGFDAGE
ncbi:MAG: hypothetical protein VB092_07125 [Oscillospiraceae bacterium]|nr:hypothetical protein [Oscillospiraceae bacterium]